MNISEEQFQQLNRNLANLTGTMGALAGKFKDDAKGRKEAADTLAGEMKSRRSLTERTVDADRQLTNYANSIRYATKTADSFANTMEELARKIPGGFVLAELLNYTGQTLDTFKKLSDYGQTFGGSLMQMSIAAGSAGLSLGDFSSAMQQNSKVVATLGQGFFAINKDVRKAAEGMGLYGMSLEQLNNFSGSYLEQQRLTGALTRAGHQRQVRAINDLAQSVSGVAKITGVARETIMEIAQAAMRDPALVAAMAGNTARGMHAYNDEINKAVTLLAAQAGKAGQMLSAGLAQTVAMGGAQFTEQAAAMLDAGFGQGALLLQQAADKLARGMDAEQVNMELVNGMKAAADNPATREALLNQARAGNRQAQEILEMTQNLKTFTRAEMEAAKAAAKRKDMLTGFATAFESIFSDLKGSFIEGFLTPFNEALGTTNFETTLKKMKEMFEPLGEVFKGLGKAWGENVKEFLTGGGLQKFIKSFSDITTGLIKLTSVVFTAENFNTMLSTVRVIADIGALVSGFMLGVVVPALGAVVDGMTKFREFLTSVFGFFKIPQGKSIASAITGALIVGAIGGMKVIFGKIAARFANLRLNRVMINAGRVFVNGMGGGGGAGGDGGGRGRGRNRGGGRAGGRPRAMPRGGGRIGRTLGLLQNVGTTASNAARRFVPRSAGRLARGAGRFLGKAALPLAFGLTAFDQLGMMKSLGDQLKRGEITKAEHDREVAVQTGGNAGGLLGGLAAGAAAGAAGGALFGGVGAIPGAIIGGGIGAFAGSSAGQWMGGKWNDWRNPNRTAPSTPKVGTSPNNPQIPQIDVEGQSARMREATRMASSDKAMENMLAEMRRMNQTLDEGRQISTAQLERQIEQNKIARGTTGAILESVR